MKLMKAIIHLLLVRLDCLGKIEKINERASYCINIDVVLTYVLKFIENPHHYYDMYHCISWLGYKKLFSYYDGSSDNDANGNFSTIWPSRERNYLEQSSLESDELGATPQV